MIRILIDSAADMNGVEGVDIVPVNCYEMTFVKKKITF